MNFKKITGKILNRHTFSLVLVISAFVLKQFAGPNASLFGLILSYYLFFVSVIFILYLPGFFINSLIKAKISIAENIFLSTVYGMLFATLIFFIFSILKLDVAALIIVAAVDYFALKKINVSKIKFSKIDSAIYFAIIFMAFIFSLTMLTSGYVGEALRLVGVNNYDGLWYLALINELKFNFPPQHPGFSGEMLTGYHFFLFFLMAKIGSIFNLSNINLMFKLFPILVSLLWALGVYVLMLAWSKSKFTALFAVFLTMFGGSAVYITWLYGYKNISLDSGYGVLQPATSLVNPTFAISIIFFIAFLLSILKYYKSKSLGWLFPIALIAGLTPIFKVYGGIIVLGGFVLFSLFEIYKRNFYILLSIIGVILLFFGTYWPFTDRSVYPVFYPLWAPHNVLRDNLSWYGYDEKIRTYSEQSVIKGIITTELFALYVFLFGNLGTRLIGLLFGAVKAIKERRLPSLFALLVWAMAGASLLIPLFFIQSGKVFETIQFMWYFLFLISLLSALGLGYFLLLKISMVIKIAVVLIIVLLTIPSSLGSISFYLAKSGGYLDQPFYESAKFLSKNGAYDEVVLGLPKKDVELSLVALKRGYMAGGPVIPAIANKRSFLSYEYFLFDVNVDERIDLMYKILLLERIIDLDDTVDVSSLHNEIKERIGAYDVKYIHSPDTLNLIGLFDNMKEVYRNSGTIIYEVQ